jgi:predicted Zn-dependent protease
MRFGMHKALPILLTGLLVACSSSSKKPSSVQVPNDAWWQIAAYKSSTKESDKNLSLVRQNMMKTVPFPFVLALSDSEEINAYANLENDKRYVIFTSGFMSQFGSDPDVLANILGHELAHHQLGHTQLGYAKNRDLVIDASSQVFGLIASYFIPFGGLVVGNATKGAGLTFSRNDEREADLMGMEWAVLAGYSPCGAYRFAVKLDTMGEGTNISFLSTHPGNSERMNSANLYSQKNKATRCEGSLEASQVR